MYFDLANAQQHQNAILTALPMSRPAGAQLGVRFEVLGTPAPKGSFRISRKASGAPLVRKDSDATEWWHDAVKRAALRACANRTPFLGCELRTIILFYVRRPVGHYGTGKNAGAVKPSAPRWPSIKPDIDKTVRATLDPMQGVVFDDDSRIVKLIAEKHYAPLGTPTGALILVQAI